MNNIEIITYTATTTNADQTISTTNARYEVSFFLFLYVVIIGFTCLYLLSNFFTKPK